MEFIIENLCTWKTPNLNAFLVKSVKYLRKRYVILILQRCSSLVTQMVICLQCGTSGFSLWVGKIVWRREWQPTPVFSPGESHGQRSLAGYSPWGRKELDMTEWLHFHFQFYKSLYQKRKRLNIPNKFYGVNITLILKT